MRPFFEPLVELGARAIVTGVSSVNRTLDALMF
jgi:hypothetical protein